MDNDLRATRETHLPLATRIASRISASIAAVLLSFMAVMWLGLLLAVGSATAEPLWVALGWSLMALFLVLTLWAVWMAVREAVARPFIALRHDKLVIHHPVVFRRDVQLPRDMVEAVAIDTPSSKGLWEASDLPVEIRYNKGVLEWSARREESLAVTDDLTRIFVPLLDRDQVLTPNLAILLRDRVDLSRLRRARFGSSSLVKTAASTRSAQGFLATVRDAEKAEEVFAAWGVVRNLNAGDRRLLMPQKEDVRRLRRAHHVAAFGIAYFVLVVAHNIWRALNG